MRIFWIIGILTLLACKDNLGQKRLKNNRESQVPNPHNMTDKIAFQDAQHRTIRHFQIIKNGMLALDIKDEPGLIMSMASPPPEGYPSHPFLSGRALNALLEDELANTLSESTSFDHFIDLLIEREFDVFSSENTLETEGNEVFRIYEGDTLLAVFHWGKGQVITIRKQPESSEWIHNIITLTIYENSYQTKLVELLKQANSKDDWIKVLNMNNLRLVSMNDSEKKE